MVTVIEEKSGVSRSFLDVAQEHFKVKKLSALAKGNKIAEYKERSGQQDRKQNKHKYMLKSGSQILKYANPVADTYVKIKGLEDRLPMVYNPQDWIGQNLDLYR